jgi:GNAT superfamily N-acetyltransferase
MSSTNGTPTRSVIEELFVAPTFRRQGYGRVLLDLAVERITSWHKKRAELLLHEADASPNGEVRAMNFGLACNFTWEGRYFRRPNVIDTAYREVAT